MAFKLNVTWLFFSKNTANRWAQNMKKKKKKWGKETSGMRHDSHAMLSYPQPHGWLHWVYPTFASFMTAKTGLHCVRFVTSVCVSHFDSVFPLFVHNRWHFRLFSTDLFTYFSIKLEKKDIISLFFSLLYGYFMKNSMKSGILERIWG